jgi:hypothetical protein
MDRTAAAPGSARLLGVLRLDALEAQAEHGLPQLVAQAAADDGLAQAAVVQRLAQRRRACGSAPTSRAEERLPGAPCTVLTCAAAPRALSPASW